VTRTLALCVLCWACRAGAPEHIALLYRADDSTARLEEPLLGPYRARHPGLQVTERNVSGTQSDYQRRLAAALASEPPPDAFLLEDADVPQFSGPGGAAALDLAPYLPRVGVDLARYDQTVLAIFRRGDAVYALPRGYTPLVVVYNRDLLARSGIAPPVDDWTWDDFLRIATRLTRDSDGDGQIDVWGVAFDRRPAFWLPWIWSGGGDVLCADGRRASGCLDAPATITALRWYAGWLTREHVAPRAYEPREEDAEPKRLSEVVVRAKVEGVGLVVLAVFCCQHQNRRPHLTRAQSPQNFVPAQTWQHDVEHDRVELLLGRPPEPV